ncbi:RPM1-interacting protein 4 [Nymphaea colorata]|nr:RPM1-interacting protein 4 [Nymphaea colorata]
MAHVPKFGNWESEESVPYTAYFEKARKDKTAGGKTLNPNDPLENPDVHMVTPPATHASRHERARSVGESEVGGQTDSPAHPDAGGRKITGSPLHPRYTGQGRPNSGDSAKKTQKENGGSERTVEHSPLHPHYQARVTNKGVSSPSWERRGSSDGGHGLAPLTPGRSKARSSTRNDDNFDKGAAVPKFGDWDEANPSSADGYTHIFNQVRAEKQVGSAKVPMISTETPAAYGHKEPASGRSSIWCCFGK